MPDSRRLRRRRASDLRTALGPQDISARVRRVSVAKRQVRADISRQKEDTDVFRLDGESYILQTPYSLKSLHNIHEKSNALRQCIASYTTNIATNGFRVVAINDETAPDPDEVQLLKTFVDCANMEESLTAVHVKQVTQYEKYGFSYLEVIRNKQGKPSLLKNAKSSQMRLLSQDKEEVQVSYSIPRGGSRTRIIERRRFRRFVQEINGAKVYFKEFGDPRRMDYRNGRYESKEYKVVDKYLATEILHNRQFSEDAYGLPRWISQLPSILGSREAEEVNLRYFEDNTVPPMIMSVSGGRLTRQSYQELTSILEARGVGRERQNQIILIEAVPEVADLEGKGNVQIKIDKLADTRPSDGLFDEYDQSNIAKIRSSFRLPPVFLGMSQDMTFATANTSVYVAEVQVFLPERKMHDEFLNKRFVNHPLGLNLKTVRLESRGPTITSPDQVIKTLTALNAMGGVTPRTAIETANEALQLSLPNYPKPGEEGYAEWMDQPITMTLRKAPTQQTGEGDDLRDEEAAKDEETRKVEQDGQVTTRQPENGNQ